MAKNSKIEWTHHTFNIAWGCNEVSPGCDHCYARTLAERWGWQVWGNPLTTPRRIWSVTTRAGMKHWQEPWRWNAAAEKAGERRRVFCSSMADVFEVHPMLDTERQQLWRLIEATPNLDWLLLTKRPEQVGRMLPADWLANPRPNVWLGTSVEDQKRADLRIPRLLSVPAVVHWLSCEPLLGPVDLTPWLWHGLTIGQSDTIHRLTPAVDWVIVGGESGHHFRPMDLGWARDLQRQCTAANAAFFYKQGSGRYPGHDTLLDGQEWRQFPTTRALVAAR